jgi:4-nitrophenyl phosphatase
MNFMPTSQRLASIEEIGFKAVLSDLDGVVYRGEDAIPGAVERFNLWQKQGLSYCFITNNAEKSPAEFAEKIRRLGIDCAPAQVLTSAEVALDYATKKYPVGSGAYVIGSASLKARVEAAGFELVETGARVVIVALDRKFDYAMMTTAVRNIIAGAELIGTNPDVIRPIAGGFYEPGTGAIVASIATSARVTPVILGKPAPGQCGAGSRDYVGRSDRYRHQGGAQCRGPQCVAGDGGAGERHAVDHAGLCAGPSLKRSQMG